MTETPLFTVDMLDHRWWIDRCIGEQFTRAAHGPFRGFTAALIRTNEFSRANLGLAPAAISITEEVKE